MLVLVAGIGVAAAYYVVHHKTGDVHKGLQEPFTLTSEQTTSDSPTSGSNGWDTM